jgi:oxygen-independent coproporphyrinogen-3 oxidase
MTRLEAMLRGSPYHGYAYAYPHKTAYRPLDPIPFQELWAAEPQGALFLYIHVPFCEMRCGFCNLFTQAQPKAGLTEQYLATLKREAQHVRQALGDATFARFAVGGGTPTFLTVPELETLFAVAEETMGARLGSIPASVETSPATATADRLALLRARGVTRVSIGVQSFAEAEVQAVVRPQRTTEVETALAVIRAAGIPTLNIDLIYGLPGQTVASWLMSLRSALRYSPEEMYLYPLYVRPLTTLGRQRGAWDDLRLDCYREGRALLRAEGYEQISMRMFRARHAPAEEGPVYCCQEDGMVGLGCGARSYTRSVHYSREYAVRAQGVREILAAYNGRPAEAFAVADYGFRLGPEDQRRRYILQSLLQKDGLSWPAYRCRFGTEAWDDLPDLGELKPLGLARDTPDRLCLTDAGLERSDTIGPWLYSAHVRQLMEGYQHR